MSTFATKHKLPTKHSFKYPVPCILNTGRGRVAMLGEILWEVPDNVTIQDLIAYWNTCEFSHKEEAKPDNVTAYKVSSSDGKRTYKVMHGPNGWSCTCTGFGFRRQCKHVDTIKKKQKN